MISSWEAFRKLPSEAVWCLFLISSACLCFHLTFGSFKLQVPMLCLRSPRHSWYTASRLWLVKLPVLERQCCRSPRHQSFNKSKPHTKAVRANSCTLKSKVGCGSKMFQAEQAVGFLYFPPQPLAGCRKETCTNQAKRMWGCWNLAPDPFAAHFQTAWFFFAETGCHFCGPVQLWVYKRNKGI